MEQPSISKSQDKEKLVIEVTDDDAHEWVERIGKTAYEICNDPARKRIKLVLSWNLMSVKESVKLKTDFDDA